MLWAWLVSTMAFGASYYLESHHVDSSGAAEGIEEQAPEGVESRVVRRHVEGRGWRYLVRVGDFESEEGARSVAMKWARAMGRVVHLYSVDDGWSREVAAVESADADPPTTSADPTATPADPAATPAVASDTAVGGPSGAALLARSMAAHGVEPTTSDALVSGPFSMTYVRELADGRHVGHQWTAQQGSIRLDIHPVQGEVQSSRVIVTEQGAWLSVADGEWTEQNLSKTRDTISKMGPHAVLPFLVGWTEVLSGDRSFTVARDDDGLVRVTRQTAPTAGALTITLDGKTALVRSIWMEDGDIVRTFDDYEMFGDLWLPRSIATRRGDVLQDTVNIQAFEREAELPTDWFEASP